MLPRLYSQYFPIVSNYLYALAILLAPSPLLGTEQKLIIIDVNQSFVQSTVHIVPSNGDVCDSRQGAIGSSEDDFFSLRNPEDRCPSEHQIVICPDSSDYWDEEEHCDPDKKFNIIVAYEKDIPDNSMTFEDIEFELSQAGHMEEHNMKSIAAEKYGRVLESLTRLADKPTTELIVMLRHRINELNAAPPRSR